MHCHEFSRSLVHLLKFFSPPFQECPEYLTREGHPRRFLLNSLVSSNFFIFLRYYFLFFISSPLVWWCPLPIFPSTCKFSFPQSILIFVGLVVLFLLLCVILASPYLQGAFFYAKFHSYVLTVYSHYMYWSFQLFFIFSKQFDIIHVH